ncbi:MAG: hypothetical protein WCA13_07865 [Terriglobales bacterium]
MEPVKIAFVPNVVGTALPFHETTEEVTNPLPLTTTVMLPVPATV